MTAGELIAQVDALRPNQYGTAEKLRWLQRLDAQYRREILDTHGERRGADEGIGPCGEGRTVSASEEAEEPYTEDTQLLCPFPWDEELYTSCLFCQIDFMNAEIEKYNQSAALFAAAWRQAADAVNRALPAGGERRWKL